jgi:riboflavin kinase/FMN adenylyltransferase
LQQAIQAMRVIRNRPGHDSGAYAPAGSVIAVGNFDGVHRGHQAIIARCRELAGATGPEAGADPLTVAVVTFEPLPQAYFRPEQAPARLATVYQKLSIFRSLGVDLVWLTRFDSTFARLTAREFVEQVLRRQLQAQHVVIGQDFRFGYRREGDVPLLRLLGSEYGFHVTTEPPVAADGERISSSGVRAHVAAGDFAVAADWLGRPFRMEGHVVRGAGVGRKLGYPTANLRIRAQPCPVGGVIAAFARKSGGPWLPAVTNVGRRPALGGGEPLLEVHFFDLDEDLYGQRLEVEFVAKLRDEADFERVDDLVAQMQRDERQARDCLAAVPPPA